jgi:membrane protein
MVNELKITGIAMKRGFQLLRKKEPLILSSSTAFFATFSLSPIIIILVHIFSLYFKSERINYQLFRTIGATFGSETAREIESIVNNFRAIESNWWITFAGFVFFLFIATTLLGVVKQAIQKIWHIRSKPTLRLKYHSRERGTQLFFIVFTGTLILFSVFIDTRLGISLDFLQVSWPHLIIQAIRFLNVLFGLIMASLWFTVLFKLIPEATMEWDTAFTGGLLTGTLFLIGKFILGKILVHARIATIFGASASIAVLLLFIFYCSFILYYGAAVTHEYGEMADNHICAGKYADEYEERIVGAERE